MKILVDADACPVKEIIVKIAKEYSIKVIMLCDTSHILYDGYSEIITVDKSCDSVDFALVNKAEKSDIVVTQDYGVATMCLSKGVTVLNQNGLIYNESNIDRLLFERHLSQKIRRSGGRCGSIRKRTKEDDVKFEKAFRGCLRHPQC
ncbi:MAG: YaiI/YqxD family protein [Clostridia bacterium]|nr:YaiI/YqxD family protein [Clostridia bacterium]